MIKYHVLLAATAACLAMARVYSEDLEDSSSGLLEDISELSGNSLDEYSYGGSSFVTEEDDVLESSSEASEAPVVPKRGRREHDRCNNHCQLAATRCTPTLRPTGSCCRRTTSDKVTTYILRRTTSTTTSTTSLTRSTTTTTTRLTTSTSTVSTTSTTTLSTTFTSVTTRSVTSTLPNTTFTVSRTSTTTLPRKTVISIVTQQIMPCFTEFETCFYNCPYYNAEPTCGCEMPVEPCGSCPKPRRCDGGYERPLEQCGSCKPRSCPRERECDLACANGADCGCNACCQSRVYVLPIATNHCVVKPTYEAIPACGCWNTPCQTPITVYAPTVPTCAPCQQREVMLMPVSPIMQGSQMVVPMQPVSPCHQLAMPVNHCAPCAPQVLPLQPVCAPCQQNVIPLQPCQPQMVTVHPTCGACPPQCFGTSTVYLPAVTVTAAHNVFVTTQIVCGYYVAPTTAAAQCYC